MEHWEPLGSGLRVLVNSRHGFTTDTLLLAHFSLPRPGEHCAELGCGCGVIPLLWCRRARPAHVTAMELQPDAAALAERSVRENGLAEAVTVIQGDVREYKSLLPHQGLDRIACNPPYYPAGTGLPSRDPGRRTARHNEALTLEDVACAARYGLKFGGRLCLCLPVSRMAEAIISLSQRRLEPKRLRLVQQRPDKAPYLFLLECRLGGRPGLTAEPTLFIQDGSGRFTREMEEIYGDYREQPGTAFTAPQKRREQP